MNHLISCLSAVLLVITSQVLSAEQGNAIEILGPNGKPVEKARIFGVWEDEEHHWGVDEISLAEWKKHAGRDIKVFKHKLMVDGRAYEYLIIDSPGCALDIWDAVHFDQPVPIPAQVKLKKEFHYWGTVVDSSGKPLKGAEVTYDTLNKGSFDAAYIRLKYVADLFPWVRVKTVEDGSYRIRGITSEGVDYSNVDVMARVKIDGATLIGHGECLLAKDLADLMGIQKRVKNEYMDGISTLVPCEVITGRVHDSQSGKPIAGALIRYLALQHYDHHDPSKDDWMECRSDEDGLFEISQIRGLNNCYVQREGYHTVWLSEPENWQGGKPAALDIPLPPIVDAEIRVIDTHTGASPALPFKLIYSMDVPLGEGWSCQTYQIAPRKEYVSISKETLKKGSKDIFTVRLPAGQLDLRCWLPEAEGDNPNFDQGRLYVTGETDGPLEVRLRRKP